MACGCSELAPSRRVNILVYGADPNPIEVDTSQLPANTTVQVTQDKGASGPITNVEVIGGYYRVVLIPTTRPTSEKPVGKSN
jgi:hypothetical protein